MPANPRQRLGRLRQMVLKCAKACERCECAYTAASLTALGRDGDLHFFVLRCRACGHRLVGAALAAETRQPRGGEAARVGTVPVTTADVDSVRAFLESFDGNFNSLFSPPSS